MPSYTAGGGDLISSTRWPKLRKYSGARRKITDSLESWLILGEANRSLRQWVVGLSLLAIVFWGFFLRVYGAGVQSLWVDEGTSLTAALGILEDGTPHLLSDVSYWRAPLHTYLISAALFFGPNDEFTARMPAILFGTATIIIAFLLGRRLGGTSVGIASAALVAFADIEITWSRQVRMYQQLQFFTLLTLYSYIMAVQQHSRKWIIGTGISAFGVAASHMLGFLIVLVIYLHFAFVRLSEVRSKQDLRSLMRPKYLLLVLVGIGVVIVSEWTQDAVSRSLSGGSSFLDDYLVYLQSNFRFVFFLGSAGLVVWLPYRPREFLVVLLAIALPLYFVSFHGNIPAFRYLYLVLPLLLIGFPLALLSVPRFLGLTRFRWAGPGLVLAGTLLAVSGSAFTIMPKTHYYLGEYAPQPDFKAAYAEVSAQMRPTDVIIDAWPTLGRFYLQRSSDYWPVFNTGANPKDNCLVAGGEREVYGNAQCLTSVSAMRDIVENNPNGWVILDGFAWRNLSAEYHRYIWDNLTNIPVRLQVDSQFEVMVFRWSRDS